MTGKLLSLNDAVYRCYYIHLEKKQQIQPTIKAPETVQKVSQQMSYMKALKNQNKTFYTNGKWLSVSFSNRRLEKNMLLNRDNQILLNKLVDISQGKN